MNKSQFLALTSSDDWLTAEEMAARLDRGGYWTEAYRAGPPELRLIHVETQMRTLRTRGDAPAFVAVEALGPDGSVIRLWKQQDCIQAEPKPGHHSARGSVVRIVPARWRAQNLMKAD